MSTRQRASSAALIFLLAAAVGCGRSADAEDTAPERPRAVLTEVATLSDAVDRIRVFADLQGEVEVRVFPQVAERITRLAVREGDQVKAGQVMATLRGDVHSAGVAQARGALEAALANRDRMRDDLARLERLAKEGAAPRAQIEGLEANLRAAEAQVRQLEAALTVSGAQRSRTVVQAPIAGTVGQVPVAEGDMANPGMPLATIVKMERVKIEARVAERDFVRIRQDMEARVTPLALPAVEVKGAVTRVAPVIDRMTRSGTVEILVDNADGLLRPGMTVRVEIELERRPGVLLVPGAAPLLAAGQGSTSRAAIFVLEGSTARRREVTLGRRYGDRIEITDGLTPGDRLIVRGQHLLRDGATVVAEDTADGA